MVEAAAQAHRLLSKARNAWPTLRTTEVDVREYLESIKASREAIESHGVDLVLACACAKSDPEALSVFERLHIANTDMHVSRLRLSNEQLEELRQIVRIRLFTGPQPRIRAFSGKGPLGAWFRMLCLRLAVDHLRAQPRDLPLHAVVLDSLVLETVPADDAAMTRAWTPVLQQAVERGLAGLPARDRTILRLHYLEGLNIEAIGAMYGVHRATVARWLLAIRARVLTTIRDEIAIRFPSTTSEIRGAFGALQSQLSVSISRVLAQR